MVAPLWFAEVSDEDGLAHQRVIDGEDGAAEVHRAARHHNWVLSSGEVRKWTEGPALQATERCKANRWTALAPISPPDGMELVTHVLVNQLRDSDLRKRLLRDRGDRERVRRHAEGWHNGLSAAQPDRGLWLGDRREFESPAVAFNAHSVHAVVAALGLWHFGLMQANEDGAVMRVTYRVGPDVHLFKPDWRHGFPNFYFANVPKETDAGRTRDLRTAQLQCKEWIVPIESLEPRRHIVAAECVVPSTEHDHHDLPVAYWRSLAGQIRIDGSAPALGIT